MSMYTYLSLSWYFIIAQMTPPAEFAANVVRSLEYLDTILPSVCGPASVAVSDSLPVRHSPYQGSHVIMIGLANGNILWDSLWNRYAVPSPCCFALLHLCP
jgi:hypothetical protein